MQAKRATTWEAAVIARAAVWDQGWEPEWVAWELEWAEWAEWAAAQVVARAVVAAQAVAQAVARAVEVALAVVAAVNNTNRVFLSDCLAESEDSGFLYCVRIHKKKPSGKVWKSSCLVEILIDWAFEIYPTKSGWC